MAPKKQRHSATRSQHEHNNNTKMTLDQFQDTNNNNNESTSNSFADSSSESDESGCQLDLTSDDTLNSPSASGRSSAENQPVNSSNSSGQTTPIHHTNQHQPTSPLAAESQLQRNSNIPPRSPELNRFVESIRLMFIGQEHHSIDHLDPLDLEEMSQPIKGVEEQEQSLAFRWIIRFLEFTDVLEQPDKISEMAERELEKIRADALVKLNEFFKFRHEFQLSTLSSQSFFRELYLIAGAFQHGHDLQGLPMLYLRTRVHRRWTAKMDAQVRTFLVGHFEQITKSDHRSKQQVIKSSIGTSGLDKDGSFALCLDCANVSYASVDMDFLRFIAKLLTTHYRTHCRYALCLDLPWMFRSIWKIVRGWLPEEARNTVHFITSRELNQFVPEDQIPNTIKYLNNDQALNELKEFPASGKHPLPDQLESIKTLEAFADQLNLSSSQVKQFKSHLDKVLKEYEQLGGI